MSKPFQLSICVLHSPKLHDFLCIVILDPFVSDILQPPFKNFICVTSNCHLLRTFKFHSTVQSHFEKLFFRSATLFPVVPTHTSSNYVNRQYCFLHLSHPPVDFYSLIPLLVLFYSWLCQHYLTMVS